MIFGIKKYNPENDYYEEDSITNEYRLFLLTKKSVMSEEDAEEKVQEYEKKDAVTRLFYSDNIELYNLVKYARQGYREKLMRKNEENVEQKVNDLYPYEIIFKYKE